MFVVSGVCDATVPSPTFICFAAGVEDKKEKFGRPRSCASCGFSSPDFVELGPAWESIDFNCAITASLRADSCFSECCSFLVSRSFCLWRFIDSGVGASGDCLPKDRFCRFQKNVSCRPTPVQQIKSPCHTLHCCAFGYGKIYSQWGSTVHI